jgi:hypothetical protein
MKPYSLDLRQRIGLFRAFGDPVTGLGNYDFKNHLLSKDKAFAQ